MPTILELFRGSDFDKAVDSKAKEGKGTLFSQIKSFGEQELTGVRVKSAVELNNPLIYGNEATRIALRSTPDMDKMRTDEGDGGLIGGTITKVRDKVNSTLGVPQTLIPSSYTKTTQDKTLNDPDLGIQSGYLKRISEIKSGGEGSFIGGLLSGGNPKTIAQQAAGKLITEAKDKVRDALFKNNPFKDPADPKKEEPTTTDFGAFSLEKKENKNIYESTKESKYSEKVGLKTQKETDSTEGVDQSVGILNLYKGNEQTVAQVRVNRSYTNPDGLFKEGISPSPRSGEKSPSFPASDDRFSAGDNNKLISDKGFTNKDDVINQSGIYDGGTGAETSVQHKLDEKDFIPLYFRNIVTGKTVHFRGTITGLNETITPAWDAARFSGNPFNFYTYQSIERNVSFNFTVYPMNSAELANNWTKIEFLTSLCYPFGYQSGDIGSVRAPIVYFTMGDLYKDRVSFIESLQYTIPDNSNWQLDDKTEQVKEYNSSGEFFDNNGGQKVDVDKGYKLPHLIEVAITMKFLEQRSNTEDRTKLYSFKSITY